MIEKALQGARKAHDASGVGSLGRISAVSYNVHRCVGVDGRRDPARIAEIIRELDADIVGLQEVDSRNGPHHEHRQMDYLAHATGFHAVAGPTILESDRYYGNILLTRFPVLVVRRTDLSVPGREPRGILDVDLDIHGLTVRVLVTHFGLRFGERRYQTERLLEALAIEPHDPLILLGDLNDWLRRGYAVRKLTAVLGEVPAHRTFPARFPIAALDRIWARPLEALESVRVCRTPKTRIASDHLPLKATVLTSVIAGHQKRRTDIPSEREQALIGE